MKQILRNTVLAAFLLTGIVQLADAGTYASGIRVSNPDSTMAFDGNFTDGTGARIWFTLNGHADSVRVWVVSEMGGMKVKSFPVMLNLASGTHSVSWDGLTDGSTQVMPGRYSFEVFTSDTGNSSSQWVQAWQNPVYLGTGIGLSSRDIEVNNDPMSPDFGNLILTEATTFYGYARLLSVRADGSLMGEYSRQLFPQGTSNTDPWFVDIAQNGRHYVSSGTLNSIFVYHDTVLVETIQDMANIGSPKGLVATAGGLLIATGNSVVKRMPNGDVDTIFKTTEAAGFTEDVAVDDSGYVYISFGPSSTTYTRIVKLSPSYAIVDTLILPDYATHLNISRGMNHMSSADDILYARARGANGGVFRVNFAADTSIKLFTPSTSTSAFHSIATDMFGNIYYANPSAEWVRMYVAPSSAPMKWTTHGGAMGVFPPGSKIVDGFDANVGRYTGHPTFSGSTVGIDAASTAAWNRNEKISGFGGSIELNLMDAAASTAGWQVRFLSGGGAPANNDSLGAVGYVGYWIKTSTAPKGAMVGIGLDDPSDPVTKRSISQPVINDGKWHLYQWNIGDSTQWTAWVVTSGSPKIKGPRVSIDAVWFYAPDSSKPWKLWLDNVSYNPGVPLGNEPGRGDVTDNGLASALDASWILQHVVKMRPFGPHQVLAGDVNLSHNGNAVNSYDASIVLANVVGKIPYLPWKQPLPPMMNINPDQPAPLKLSIASASGNAGKKVLIPVSIPYELAGLRSAEMTVSFKTDQLKVTGVVTSELTKEFSIASNVGDGVVSIALAGADALSYGGTIVILEAEMVTDGDAPLSVGSITLNEESVSSAMSTGSSRTGLPETYALSQNYPNPFNPSTTIEYQLPFAGQVDLTIFDITGREISTLVSEVKNAGSYRITWNGTDNRGMKVASGIYFYRINAGSFTQIKKMMLLK